MANEDKADSLVCKAKGVMMQKTDCFAVYRMGLGLTQPGTFLFSAGETTPTDAWP